MRSIIFLLGMFLYLIITLPLLLVLKLTKNKNIAYKFGLRIGRLGNFLAGNKVEVVNHEYLVDNPGSLVVANHEGIFDAYNLYANMPYKFGVVSKKENGKIPILGSWTDGMDVLLMDRSDMRQSMKIINQAAKLLKEGMSICIYPEGTRSTEHMEFHAGSFKIATKAKSDIICITNVNTADIFENNKKIKAGKTVMYIHEPIRYEDIKDLDTGEIAKLCQEKIRGVALEK